MFFEKRGILFRKNAGKGRMSLKENDQITGKYASDSALLRERLGCARSFDLVERTMCVAERQAALYFVDGLVKDEVMEKVMEFLLKLKPEDVDGLSLQAFADRNVPYIERDAVTGLAELADGVLCGQIGLLLDGLVGAILIDARTYPTRGAEEPDGDKVLHGARDGFVETIVTNTALLRRRLRTGDLIMEYHAVCDRSKTDVVLCYLDGKANPKLLARVRERIARIDLHALTMTQQTLSQCLLDRQWWNPFPRMRLTERPDVAAAQVAEGRILVLVDNSPVVMVIPSILFDFSQEANDFYFPPLVGSFLRLMRMTGVLLTLFLVPVWFLLIQNPGWLSEPLQFLLIENESPVPVFWQLVVTEVVLDILRMASMNTPTTLSNAFSVVGALLLGDFGIQVGWLVPEVVLYMGFTTVASFSQPSYELGYAIKIFRVVFLILTALWNVWGFAAAFVLLVLALLCTRTVGKSNYLRPIAPFSGNILANMFRSRPAKRDNT